jgi:hypothetical protein
MFSKKGHKAMKLRLATIIVLAVAALALPAPVQAGTLKWTIVDTPGNTSNVIVSPSEINFIAVAPDGMTIYATDVVHNKVYKSINGGAAWDNITSSLTSAGAVMPVWNIATAPDNPSIVVVTTSVGGLPANVFFSIDGGTTWQNTNCPAISNIGALDISMNYKNYDIVIGTRTGLSGGKVYIYRFPGSGGWADQGFTGDVLAAKFSPGYVSDTSLMVVSTNATGTYAHTGIRDTAANTTNWTAWTPIEITTSGAGTSPKANQIKTADLELPFDFVGQSPAQRHIYISIDDAGITGNAGIYRIDDNIIYKLMPSTGTKRISSIAFFGPNSSGKLLAGEVKANASLATVDTWLSPNAGAACPQATCIIWQKSVKPPTGGASSGNANAQVAWGLGGARAYCATSSANLDGAGWPNGYLTSIALDESAFSISLDDGKTWNQLSLIDTAINVLSDVAAIFYSDTLYLASINTNTGLNGFDSLWRSTSQPLGRTWERVLCILTSSNETIIRLSPPTQSTQSVFFGARSTSDLFNSNDKGQSWNQALPGINITDFAVTQIGSIPTLFVLDNNSIRRGEYVNQLWRWGSKVNTNLNTGHTITATASGVVVVGDAGEGMVTCSIDNGTQFIPLPPLPVPGNVHAVVDARFTNNVVIYAASDSAAGKAYSWVINTTSAWLAMATPSQSFFGLAQAGTLYCIWSNAGNSGVNRTLNPEALQAPLIEWSNMNVGLSPDVVFTREPTALKISGGVDIWAIDNRQYTANSGRLWHYCDCLTPSPIPYSTQERPSLEFQFQAPQPVSPAMNAKIPINTDTEEIADINFQWQHPTWANGYDIWIAKDKEFNRIVLKQSITPKIPAVPSWILSSPEKAALETGGSYFWRVRVNRNEKYQRGEGQWSETMSFNVTAKPAPASSSLSTTLLIPANNDTGINRSPKFSWMPLENVIEYEFILSQQSDLQQPIVNLITTDTTIDLNTELNWGTTYYWQVKAIKPFISQPSPIFRFTIVTPEEPIAPTKPQILDIPFWLWLVIIFLIIAILAAIIITVTTRRSSSRI